MAEFVIFAKDNTHPDAWKDAAGCYKRGDIVEVMPDGHKRGSKVTLPKFLYLKVPGLDAKRARKYLEEHKEQILGGNAPIARIARRRKYRLRVDDLPGPIRGELLTTGEVTLTWAQARDFLRDKISQRDETGKPAP